VAVLASWFPTLSLSAYGFRAQLVDASSVAFDVAQAVFLWYAAQPVAREVFLFLLLVLFLAEMWFLHVKTFAYRIAWRSIFPDLATRKDPRDAPNVVGRIYRTRRADPLAGDDPSEGAWVTTFSVRGAGVLQLFTGLSTIRHDADLSRDGTFRRILPGHGIRPVSGRVREWELTTDQRSAYPVGERSVYWFFDHNLSAHEEGAQRAIEGNP
jgi:hypothetical protein